MASERLGRYELLRPLATGGMGEILLAEHTGLSGFAKRVVVKRIRPALASNASYVELFLNEARVGSFLNHPNIVHIFDVGHERDNLWLVMEYVDGVDLKRLMRRSRLAGQIVQPTTLAAIIINVLLALSEAHAGGPTRGEPIIHRDMSPENILIARSGSIKVLDFGLAKWAPGKDAVSSLEGDLIFGKTRYMPPEQLKGELIDVRTDLFALGVVMYEALAGVLPFGAGSANSVLANIVAGGLPGPTEDYEEPDPDIDAIVFRALQPDANERYQTSGEMRAALVDYLRDHGPKLPLERLRCQLQPGHALGYGSRSSSEMADASAAYVPTEIGLAIAKRCGKCGGAFTAFFHEGLIVDQCTHCHGLWLDKGEIMRILGERSAHATQLDTGPNQKAPYDNVVGSCPVCKVGLRPFSVPGQPASFEICGNCIGVWFDEGEIELLRNDDVVTWFRTLLDSMRMVG